MTDAAQNTGLLGGATVASGDLGASLGFYRDLLGMEVVRDEAVSAKHVHASWGLELARDTRLVTLSGGSASNGLLRLLDVAGMGGEPIRDRPSMRDPGPLAFDFAVADLDAAHRELSAAGFEFYSPPQDVGNVRICFCLAPDCVMTALIEFGPDHALRREGRPYVGVINVAQGVDSMADDLAFYTVCFGVHTALDYVMHHDERGNRLRRATGQPAGSDFHLVNLVTEPGIPGFQGGGTVELIQPLDVQGPSASPRAVPPNRGYFLTSLRVADVEACLARCRERHAQLLTDLAPADELTGAPHFVVRSPSAALLEVVQAA